MKTPVYKSDVNDTSDSSFKSVKMLFARFFTVRESWHTHGAETRTQNFSSHKIFTIFISWARKILILILKNRSFSAGMNFCVPVGKTWCVCFRAPKQQCGCRIYHASVETKFEIFWKNYDFIKLFYKVLVQVPQIFSLGNSLVSSWHFS